MDYTTCYCRSWGSRSNRRHAQHGMTLIISSTGSSQVLIPEVSVTLLARIFHKKAQTSCKSLIEWYV